MRGAVSGCVRSIGMMRALMTAPSAAFNGGASPAGPGRAAVRSTVRLSQQRQQLPMQRLVAAGDRAGRQRVIPAVGIADESARLAHEDQAGADVPAPEMPLPVEVETPAGDPGEIERGGAHPPDA